MNYNKAARVVENVSFLTAQNINEFEHKIMVVDNSCNKEQENILRSGLSRVRNDFVLVINKKNVGYTKGYNMVSDELEGEYVLIVNPDILFRQKDTLQKMVQYLDAHLDVALLGPKQINDDGSLAMTVRAFPKFYVQVARRTFLKKIPYFKKRLPMTK